MVSAICANPYDLQYKTWFPPSKTKVFIANHMVAKKLLKAWRAQGFGEFGETV